MKKFTVTLSKKERAELKQIASRGKHRSQKVLNSLILLGCDEGELQYRLHRESQPSMIINISVAE